MADAGLRLLVEGEKEFKSALSSINAQIKVNKSELKLLTEEYKLNDTGMEKLQEKQKALADSMALQGDKVKLLQERYQAAAEQYGETDTRVLRLKESLNLTSAELAKTTAEWEKNQEEIEEFDKKTETVVRAEEELRRTLEEVESGLRLNTSELKLLDAQYGDAENAAGGLTEKNQVLSESVELQKKKIEALTKALNDAKVEYGEQSKVVYEYREQLNNAQTDIIETTKQIEKNNEELEKTKDMGGLLEGLDVILEKIGVEVPDGIKGMIEGFDLSTVAAGGIGVALAGAAGKVKEITQEAIEWADELTTKSQMIGINTEELQALEYAAAALGVSTDTIEDALTEIINKAGETDEVVGEYIGNIHKLRNASEEEREAVAMAMAEWDKYGVALYDADGNMRDSIEIFYDLIDVFRNVSNSTERLSMMQQLLGESAKKLNPIVIAGTDTLEKLKQEAYDTGVVMKESTVSGLDASASAWKKWEYRVKSAVRTIPEALANLFSGAWIENVPKLIFGDIELPKYANGTDFHPGGMAIVGEQGPELVRMPRGSQVIPNNELKELGGDVYNVNVNVQNISELQDIVRMVKGQKQNIRMGYTGG